MARNDIDILIGGGGFAGLALAIALRQSLGPSFAVVVADPALGASHADDDRASAIVAAARRLFEAIGVWERMADDAQPILDMVVTDSRLDDAVRPVFLNFAGDIEPGEPFAHMIENRRWSMRSPRRRRTSASHSGRSQSRNLRTKASGSTCGLPMARRYRQDCWSPPMARARPFASAPASPRMAGAIRSPPS